MGAKSLLLRALKVPPDPRVPAASAAVRVFRASPRYFSYRLVAWGFKQLGALAGLVAGLLLISNGVRAAESAGNSGLALLLRAVEALAWASYILQIPFSLAVLKLDYELRWYILSDRSLRIREGTLLVKEKTMTFANIQQISIERNPLQRLLRIGNVHVRTAGGGSGGGEASGAKVGEDMHEAYFRGVDDPEGIRTLIRERVHVHRDAGLGDPDDREARSSRGSGDTLLEALREATRDLRASLGNQPR